VGGSLKTHVKLEDRLLRCLTVRWEIFEAWSGEMVRSGETCFSPSQLVFVWFFFFWQMAKPFFFFYKLSLIFFSIEREYQKFWSGTCFRANFIFVILINIYRDGFTVWLFIFMAALINMLLIYSYRDNYFTVAKRLVLTVAYNVLQAQFYDCWWPNCIRWQNRCLYHF
jgi:hypothetical protein